MFLATPEFQSTAVLVNSHAEATYVDVTVRDGFGSVAVQQRVSLPARNHVGVNINDLLLDAHSPATRGSVQIAPAADGTGIGVIGQMSIKYIGSSEPSYLEYEPTRPGSTDSPVLEAVSDAGTGSPVVGITSVSSSVQHVTVQCLGARAKVVTLAPNATIVTAACDAGMVDPLAEPDFGSGEAAEATPHANGVTLTSDGAPGSFAALGFAPHGTGADALLTAVPFSDPKQAQTATTVFAGLPVGYAAPLPGGSYVPELALANFSASSAHVSVQYSTMLNGQPQVSTVASVTVAAGSTASVSLTGLQGDPSLQNSFEVVSDGAPGAVQAKLSSRSRTGVHWVEMPGKDRQNSHNAGNHPWTVANGTDSTMLLFNELNTTETFTVLIASGTSVWNKKYTLPALATQAIDINQILADGVKDDSGFVLPKGLQSGEVNWLEAQQFGGTGRLLQSNPADLEARSFSCGEHSVIIGGDFSQGTTSEAVGQTNEFGELDAQVGLTESSGGCSGDYVGDGDDYQYLWSSSETGIAAISGSAGGDRGQQCRHLRGS